MTHCSNRALSHKGGHHWLSGSLEKQVLLPKLMEALLQGRFLVEDRGVVFGQATSNVYYVTEN